MRKRRGKAREQAEEARRLADDRRLAALVSGSDEASRTLRAAARVVLLGAEPGRASGRRPR